MSPLSQDVIETGFVLFIMAMAYWATYEPPKEPYVPKPGDHPFDFYLNE